MFEPLRSDDAVVVNIADSGVVVNCNEDDVDNDGSDDVIVVPEVVSVNSDDVVATVGCPLMVGSAVSRPEVVTCSVGNCVLVDELSDVICDVTDDVVMTEVVEDVLVSVVSWNPK